MIDSAEKMKAIGVSARSLRAVGACVDLNASIAAKMLASEQRSLVSSLFGFVSDVITILDQKKGQKEFVQVLSDESFVRKVQVAVGCLYIVRSIWKYARSLHLNEGVDSTVGRLRLVVEEETSLLSSLASFVFNHAYIQAAFVGQESSAAQHGRSTLLKLATLALDIMSAEIAWVQANSDRIGTDLLIVRALEVAMENDMSRLVSACKQYLTIRSFTIVC